MTAGVGHPARGLKRIDVYAMIRAMPTTTITDEAARAAAEKLRDAEAAFNTARRERNDLVLAALDEKWPHSRIAAAFSLTRGRVNQIARMR